MNLTKEAPRMMSLDEPKAFELVHARSIDDALGRWESERTTAYLAGGCDLLDQVKQQWHNPLRIIDLKPIDALRAFDTPGPTIRLGALTTLTAIERDARIRTAATALAQAAERVATLQIRNRGTIGGNLLQDGRCPYYRGPWRCYRAGGIVCDAFHGINAEHALFGASRCYIVSPSDTAVALVALDAQVTVADPRGRRAMPVEALFVGTEEDILHLHRLHDGSILADVRIDTARRRRSAFRKATMRGAWEFALTSIAVSHVDGRDWRVVAGGVAAVPWRLRDVEALLDRESRSPAVRAEAARLAIAGARPLEHNEYKVPLLGKLVETVLDEVG